MKKQIRNFLTLVLCTGLFSCAKNDPEIQPDAILSDTEQMTFNFNDVDYTSTYSKSDTDGVIVLNDSSVNAVYQKMIQSPSLATLVQSDGQIKYFENDARLQNMMDIKLMEKEGAISAKNITSGNFIAYEMYGNVLFTHSLDASNMRSLKSIGGYNDRTVKFDLSVDWVYGEKQQYVYMVFYEDINYKGHSIWFECFETSPRISADLRRYKLSETSAQPWSESVSSLAFGIADVQ